MPFRQHIDNRKTMKYTETEVCKHESEIRVGEYKYG